MCECGCGDFHPDFKITTPEYIYAIQIYTGCHDCDTPAGITFERFKANDEDSILLWDLKHVPEMWFWGPGESKFDIDIFDRRILKKALKEFAVGLTSDDYDFDGFVDDAIDDKFDQVASDTKWGFIKTIKKEYRKWKADKKAKSK
jgi:hypothetical protein